MRFKKLWTAGPTLEPPLPRRKKCPELAYKTHEFITAADGGGIDAIDSNVVADKVWNKFRDLYFGNKIILIKRYYAG